MSEEIWIRTPCHRGGKARQEVRDRFIAPRSLFSARCPWFGQSDPLKDSSDRGMLERDLPSRRRREYHRLLLRALDGGTQWAGGELPKDREWEDWPVKPRDDPLVCCPKVKLHLPHFPTRANGQLVDWGANGKLAVSFLHTVYIWSEGSDSSSGPSGLQTYHPELLTDMGDYDTAESVCWSPRPDSALLLLGTACGFIMGWDCVLKQQVQQRLLSDGQPVNTINWHPNESVFAAGTGVGGVYLLTSNLVPLRYFVFHQGKVTRVAFSPDGSLLASAGIDGKLMVWNWSSGLVGRCFDARSTITSLSWHPWRNSVLAVGSLAGGVAILNNANRKSTKISYRGPQDHPVRVTALSFSPHTGELIVAFKGKQGTASQVAVLADLTTVVDRLQEHSGAVNFLCWSPDGTYLATAAGADEMLCIWNFLGAKTSLELRTKAIQSSREAQSGLKRQFGCIIR